MSEELAKSLFNGVWTLLEKPDRTAKGIGDFDLAFCHEAMARASAVDGNHLAAAGWRAEAERSAAACADADADDRESVLADLATIPT